MSKLCNKSRRIGTHELNGLLIVFRISKDVQTPIKKRGRMTCPSQIRVRVSPSLKGKRQVALLCYDTEDPLNALQNRDKKYYYYSWTRTYSNTCMWVFVSQLFECAKLSIFFTFFLRYIPKISLYIYIHTFCPGTPKPVTNLSIIIMRRERSLTFLYAY